MDSQKLDCDGKPVLRLAAAQLAIAQKLLEVLERQINHSLVLFEQSIQIGEMERRSQEARDLVKDYGSIAQGMQQVRTAFGQTGVAQLVEQGGIEEQELDDRPDWFWLGPGKQYPLPQFGIGDQVQWKDQLEPASNISGIVMAIEWDDEREDWQYGVLHDDESGSGFVAWGQDLEAVAAGGEA